MQRSVLFNIITGAFTLWLAVPCSGLAKTKDVRISLQYGLSYLPIHVVKSRGLIEKHAAEAGLPPVTVHYTQFNGGAAINDALISGDIDYGVAGIAPALTLWDKTRNNLDGRKVGRRPLVTCAPKIWQSG